MARGRLTAKYEAFSPLRTRCPGPLLGDTYGLSALATGSIPLTALRRHKIAITLTAPRGTYYDGYSIRLAGAITITIRIGPTSSHVIPAG